MRKCDYFIKMLSDFDRGVDLKAEQVYGLNNKKLVDNLINRGYAKWVAKEEIEGR